MMILPSPAPVTTVPDRRCRDGATLQASRAKWWGRREDKACMTMPRAVDTRGVQPVPGAPSRDASSRAGGPPPPSLPVVLLGPHLCRVDSIGTRVVVRA
ncbi:hypothetical protein GS506_17945 [Rhodococcus hoagii]|nr:hypothetical protein [Prescottella equi]